MSILIEGMEMPKDRPQLLWIYPNGKALTVQSDVDPWKELQAVHIPPHGRLGDLDALKDKWTHKDLDLFSQGWSWLRDLNQAPTVIPASGEE